MVTYQDLRDWISTNKGEETAQLLDYYTPEEDRGYGYGSLSMLLLGLFVFKDTAEGHDFWNSIYMELRESDYSDSSDD